MSLYRKVDGQFALLTEGEEATIRTQVEAGGPDAPLLGNDSGRDVVLDDDAAAEIRAAWAANEAAGPSPLDNALATIANYRWNRTQRMDYDGETDVPADPALSVITSIAVAEQLAPSGGATRTFKLKPGAFRQWSVAQIIGYGMAIGAYVQACFDREEVLAAQAEGGDIAGALAALETGWPA